MSNKIKKSFFIYFVFAQSMVPQIFKRCTNTYSNNRSWIAYCIFHFRRRFYTLINRPLPSAYVNSKFYFLYPDISHSSYQTHYCGHSCTPWLCWIIHNISEYKKRLQAKTSLHDAHHRRNFVLLSYLFLEGAIAFKSSGGQ